MSPTAKLATFCPIMQAKEMPDLDLKYFFFDKYIQFVR